MQKMLYLVYRGDVRIAQIHAFPKPKTNLHLESKLANALCRIKIEISSMKTTIIKLCKNPNIDTTPNADVIKNKTEAAVFVHPKMDKHPASQTKIELMQKINPTENDFQLVEDKRMKDCGILIGYKTNEKLEMTGKFNFFTSLSTS